MQLVAEASTGREAVEWFRTHRPDVTLMDLQMPDVEAIIAIGGEFPEARIIVLSTHSGDVQVARALKAGDNPRGTCGPEANSRGGGFRFGRTYRRRRVDGARD